MTLRGTPRFFHWFDGFAVEKCDCARTWSVLGFNVEHDPVAYIAQELLADCPSKKLAIAIATVLARATGKEADIGTDSGSKRTVRVLVRARKEARDDRA